MTWRPLGDAARHADPKPVADSLDAVTRGLGPQGQLLVKLISSWDGLVGPTVAAHARPVSLVRGLLTVEVDQPAWATELRYLSEDLCRRCREVLGTASISSVNVRVRLR